MTTPKRGASSPRTRAHPASHSTGRTRATPATPATPDPATAFTTQDPAAAYGHFLPLAQAIAASAVTPFRLDPDVVRANVDTGAGVFAPIAAAVHTALPSAPVNDFLELPSLALALIYAADQVVGHASTGDIKQHVATLTTLREPTLAQLEVFASPLVNLADPNRVHAIRTGSGVLKRAHDAVNIAGYFAELGSAVTGKHPFTAAQLASLSQTGQWLVAQLTPSQAPATPPAVDPAAVIRDQLWTLLSTRDDAMRAAAATVLGFDGVQSRIPSLGSHVGHPHKAAAATTATPATANATPTATTATPASTTATTPTR